MAVRKRPDIVLAPGEQPSPDLQQALAQWWGMHHATARAAYNWDRGVPSGQALPPTTDAWLTGLAQLALDAAAKHPKPFARFCEYFLRGPGGSWAANSLHIEPLARPETALQLEEWWNMLLVAKPPPESKALQELLMAAYIAEMRVRPLLLAIAYLVRLIRDGPGNDLVDQLKNAFFTTREEKWGGKISTFALYNLDGAYAAATDAMTSAKATKCLMKETRLHLEDLLASLSNDASAPESKPDGTSGRVGLNTLRNQVFHGNASQRDGGGYAINFADMFVAFMEGRTVPQRGIAPEGIEKNLGAVFGLSALLSAWENYMLNVYA
ncbi:MAG TPA: hypothetical protein VGB18_08505, partial [Candidatus Thermoplasmatota archaeon]